MTSETFKDIPRVSGYQISNFGNVKSLKVNKILKPQINNWGYRSINLNGKNYMVYKLVATVFIPNPQNKPFVIHKDGDKTNDNVNNLEFVFENEKNRHSHIIQRRTQTKPNNGRSTPIINTTTGEQFNSIREASRKIGISPNAILFALKGQTKTAGGYRWEYLF